MKALCDVHIARKAVRFFQENNLESIHTNDILDGYFTKDRDLSQYAERHQYTLLSKDADFKDSHLLKNASQRLIKINLGNIPTNLFIAILKQYLSLFIEKMDAGSCYVAVNSTSQQAFLSLNNSNFPVTNPSNIFFPFPAFPFIFEP
jgi:predicted nuclease of predicted toxin-antitoxin system